MSKAEGGLTYLTDEGRRPEAVRYIASPETLSFQSHLPGEVLMIIEKRICSSLMKSAFNLWKQDLLERLFTYDSHDNVKRQQMRLETTLFLQALVVHVKESNLYILLWQHAIIEYIDISV